MSDLIERLNMRALAMRGLVKQTVTTKYDADLCEEAAVEIASLRSQLEEARRDALEKAAITAKLFTTSQHIAFDMQSGIFPNQSPIQDAIAAAIRSLSQEREG